MAKKKKIQMHFAVPLHASVVILSPYNPASRSFSDRRRDGQITPSLKSL